MPVYSGRRRSDLAWHVILLSRIAAKVRLVASLVSRGRLSVDRYRVMLVWSCIFPTENRHKSKFLREHEPGILVTTCLHAGCTGCVVEIGRTNNRPATRDLLRCTPTLLARRRRRRLGNARRLRRDKESSPAW